MKLYIIGPDGGGEGVYDIVAETGDALASHFCSNRSYAMSDLEARRPERQKEWKERFGEYEVLYLGDDDLTTDELVARNKSWYAAKCDD